MVKLLLEWGGDPNLLNYRKENAFSIAKTSNKMTNNQRILELLKTIKPLKKMGDLIDDQVKELKGISLYETKVQQHDQDKLKQQLAQQFRSENSNNSQEEQKRLKEEEKRQQEEQRRKEEQEKQRREEQERKRKEEEEERRREEEERRRREEELERRRREEEEKKKREQTTQNEIKMIALYNYKAAHQDELNFNKGETIVMVGSSKSKGWFVGYLEKNPNFLGNFPGNYVKNL